MPQIASNSEVGDDDLERKLLAMKVALVLVPPDPRSGPPDAADRRRVVARARQLEAEQPIEALRAMAKSLDEAREKQKRSKEAKDCESCRTPQAAAAVVIATLIREAVSVLIEHGVWNKKETEVKRARRTLSLIAKNWIEM